MRPVLATVSIALLASCGTLLGISGDDDGPVDAGSTATDATDSPASAEGGSTSPDGGCDARCLVFHDDFERPTPNVLGPWTKVVGAPLLAAGTGVGNGQALVARGGLGSNPTFREHFVETTLAPARGLEILLTMRPTTSDAGAFGTDVLDYCEFVSLVLDGKRIMLVYRDGSSDYLWIFGVDEANGTYQELPAGGLVGRVAVRMTWDDSNVTGKLARDGIDLVTVTRPIKPSAVNAPPVIRVGARCVNVTPDVELVADDVDIYSPP